MKTASTEREAIVAYLRNWAHSTFAADNTLLTAADAIERGDHIKDQDHGRA